MRSKAIIRLVRDYEFRRFLGSNGRSLFKKYNWNDSLDIINKFIKFIDKKK